MSKHNSSSALPPKNPLSNFVPENDSGKFRKPPGPDDVASMITDEALLILRKKYFFPNELLDIACKKSDRVHSPPPGYISVFEMSLKAGLRFPLAAEFIAILTAYEICLSQLSSRAVMVIVGLIAFFREHRATLTPNFFARIGKFTCDAQGHVTFRSKWLEMRTKDALKNWSSRFFLVKNDWGLLEKWGKLKELPVPLHTSEDDILRALNIHSVEDLQFKTRFIYKYTREEALFKFGLSIQPGRSDAQRLKKSKRPIEEPIPPPKESDKRSSRAEKDLPALKKKRSIEIADDETRILIPDDVLNHHCLGYQQAEEYFLQRSSIDSKLDLSIKRWNSEFVKVKYLHGEYKRKHAAKVRELRESDVLLEECRVEITSLTSSLSLQRQEVDRAHGETLEAQIETEQALKDLETVKAEMSSLESTYKKKLEELTETTTTVEKSKVIDEFKNSLTLKTIIQEQVEEAREEIYDTEVKNLERQSLEEGLLRGFLKGIRLVHRRTGAFVDDLTFSQISEDSAQDFDDDADSTHPVVIESDADV